MRGNTALNPDLNESHLVVDIISKSIEQHKSMSYVFKYKISKEDLGKILVNHLKLEGMIGDREVPLFKGIEVHGSSHFVEFFVPETDYEQDNDKGNNGSSSD